MSTALHEKKRSIYKQRSTLSRNVKYRRAQPEVLRHRSPVAAISLAIQGTCELSFTTPHYTLVSWVDGNCSTALHEK